MHFNYLRQMGGVLLANITDFYRPAMVHGLGPYLRTMPQALAQAFDAGSGGFKASLKEAKLAGLVSERVTHSLMAANGDIADPFLTRTTQVERFMQKASQIEDAFEQYQHAANAAGRRPARRHASEQPCSGATARASVPRSTRERSASARRCESTTCQVALATAPVKAMPPRIGTTERRVRRATAAAATTMTGHTR